MMQWLVAYSIAVERRFRWPALQLALMAGRARSTSLISKVANGSGFLLWWLVA